MDRKKEGKISLHLEDDSVSGEHISPFLKKVDNLYIEG